MDQIQREIGGGWIVFAERENGQVWVRKIYSRTEKEKLKQWSSNIDDYIYPRHKDYDPNPATVPVPDKAALARAIAECREDVPLYNRHKILREAQEAGVELDHRVAGIEFDMIYTEYPDRIMRVGVLTLPVQNGQHVAVKVKFDRSVNTLRVVKISQPADKKTADAIFRKWI